MRQWMRLKKTYESCNPLMLSQRQVADLVIQGNVMAQGFVGVVYLHLPDVVPRLACSSLTAKMNPAEMSKRGEIGKEIEIAAGSRLGPSYTKKG